MEQLNGIVTYFKTLKTEDIRDFILAFFIAFLFVTFSSLVAKGLIRVFMLQQKKEEARKSPFYLTFRLLFSWIGIYFAIYVISPSPQVWAFTQKAFEIGMIYIIANFIANLVSYESVVMRRIRRNTDVPHNDTLQKFACKVLKVIIYLIAAFLIMMELDYDISGLLTGLGLGGVVLALAAQDLAKNLFGGMAIVLDKPFKVGDWIKIGEFEGTVEDITFRSTRLRTIDDSEVTIQNSVISNDSIVNWSKLGKRRHSLKLNLPFDLPMKTVDKIVKRIRFVLEANNKVVPDSVGVFFSDIPQTGFEITIYMYTEITAFAPYMEWKNDINEQIVRVLESEGVKIAYPGQNIYIHQKGQEYAVAKIKENTEKTIQKKKEVK